MPSLVKLHILLSQRNILSSEFIRRIGSVMFLYQHLKVVWVWILGFLVMILGRLVLSVLQFVPPARKQAWRRRGVFRGRVPLK